MHFLLNKMINLSIVIFMFLLISCESEALPVSASFLDDNSFMVEAFTSIEDALIFQDNSTSIGDSYRLYAGDIRSHNNTTTNNTPTIIGFGKTI